MTDREIVKQFAARWPDEKLAAVFAFNQDGKMRWSDSCCCLLGVDGSDVLHQEENGICPVDVDFIGHYAMARSMDAFLAPLSGEKIHTAEEAYYLLASFPVERNRIFGEILSELMAERAAAREQPVEVTI